MNINKSLVSWFLLLPLHSLTIWIAVACSQAPLQQRAAVTGSGSLNDDLTEQKCVDVECARRQAADKIEQERRAAFYESELGPTSRDTSSVSDIDAEIAQIAAKNQTKWYESDGGSLQASWPKRNIFVHCKVGLSVIHIYAINEDSQTAVFEKLSGFAETATAVIDNHGHIDIYYQHNSKRYVYYRSKNKADRPFGSAKLLTMRLPEAFFPELSVGLTQSGFPVLYVQVKDTPRGSKVQEDAEILRYYFDESRTYRADNDFEGSIDTLRQRHRTLLNNRSGNFLHFTDEKTASDYIKQLDLPWSAESQSAFLQTMCSSDDPAENIE